LSSNWTPVTDSRFPWEREALEFVRSRFPTHEPWRAWSNFEFIADDGSINEVDLLVLSPQGVFVIEIKSRPGRLTGDAGTWIWESNGQLHTVDNPLFLVNLKAKKLRSLLERQKAARKTGLPWFEALVFCSAPDLQFQLQGQAATRVCLRDREAAPPVPARPGILAALQRRECPGLDPNPRGNCDRPMARLIARALEEAGIRTHHRQRKVADLVLEASIAEGPGYQDWAATHVQLKDVKRRVRLYLVRNGTTAEERESIERAAFREFQILDTLQHPGVLRTYGCTAHDLGQAVILEHDPAAVRLDHFLAQRGGPLPISRALDFVRQIAEVIRFAHEKKVVHRALSPQSILVYDADRDHPRLKVFNWQVGYRAPSSTTAVSRPIAATAHVDRLVEAAATAYMAPEALTEVQNVGEHLDVFSLGAIAYHVFSGHPPAADGSELSDKIRATKGLQISAVLNGAIPSLQELVRYSTHPEVPNRFDSVADFLGYLETVEGDLTTPDAELKDDPTQAKKGDRLPGGYVVEKTLGKGSCSVAFLVIKDKHEFVLKAAHSPEHNARLHDEGEVLAKIRHPHIVEHVATIQIGDRTCVLMKRAGEKTLGQRLREEGALSLEFLQRFGDDLLEVTRFLEDEAYVPHRDIKPDNIGVAPLGRGDKPHLVLFDFSLSRTPPETWRAGTPGYLDPMLPLRKRWDLHAERYAVAATLYELATGHLPRWGDGLTDASHLQCDGTVESELFDASVRSSLTAFFQRAFRRDPSRRFDNAEQMLSAWREVFRDVVDRPVLENLLDEKALRAQLAAASFDTTIHELALGTRTVNALDRANVLTVEDLLSTPAGRFRNLRGVGNKTRREILLAVQLLRERLGDSAAGDGTTANPGGDKEDLAGDPAAYSIDRLALLISSARDPEPTRRTLRAILGHESPPGVVWPTQAEVSRIIGVTRARVGQILIKAQDRWGKSPWITALRAHMVEIIEAQGGVMTLDELTRAILDRRGSAQDDPLRSVEARAVLRAAAETERARAEPRVLVGRQEERILFVNRAGLAGYACALGDQADRMADEDPLLPPARVLDRLLGVFLPPGMEALAAPRLLRLAVSASAKAALSSRQEIYPRDMDALRALRLSQGAIMGVSELTADQLQQRVRSRYPEAAPLPSRPALDDLLEQAGLELRWNPKADEGRGAYESIHRQDPTLSSGSSVVPRESTTLGTLDPLSVTPEVATARDFEERLTCALQEGAFRVLLVPPKYYQRAADEIARRFAVAVLDFEALFLTSLREEAEAARVNWELVLKTDAHRDGADWSRLLLLVGRMIPRLERRLEQVDRTAVLTYPGLVARYDRLDLIERLRDRVGRRDGIPGLWLLVPGDQAAVIDGKPIPLLSPAQRVRVPEIWVENRHRSGMRAVT